ncbi:MAG: hypothetical protein RBS80_03975 [Thermoguttaceae bacterium]|nr:hypothetical protein [Thermoguttaceae bacterium]
MFMFALASAHADDPDVTGVANRGFFPGYEKGDRALLERLLQKWHEASQCISDDIVKDKPAIERAVYEAYSTFYQPDELLADCDYVIVQASIDVILVRGDLRKVYWEDASEVGFHERLERMPRISRATYHGFRPKLDSRKRKVLYIDEEHLSHLGLFLAGDVQSKGTGDCTGMYFPQQPNESLEAQRRLTYLNSLLDIVPGHFGSGWHIATQPFVYEVYLNAALSTAVFECRDTYEGLRVLLERKEGGWKVIDKASTWVQ